MMPASDGVRIVLAGLVSASGRVLSRCPRAEKPLGALKRRGRVILSKAGLRENAPPKTMPLMETTAYWPFAAYFLAVVAITIGMLGLSAILGQRHRERATGEPYEGGIVSTGSARLRLSVRFYLVAILFVIFDLEVIFIFAWAIAVRELGWSGFIGVVVFIAIMLAALIYEWRMGALDWGKSRRVREQEFQKRQERVQ
jgi:NADH-quinone oxidoreductase subunit A